MHLSEKNNRPELALESALDALAGRAVTLRAARQHDRMALEPEASTR